ncbi:MAG: hypothetical protein ACREOE_09530 [Gemmatimonadales bacterium]
MAGSGMLELDVQLVRHWCDQRVPEHLRDQVRWNATSGPGI